MTYTIYTEKSTTTMKGEHPIYLNFTHHGSRFRVATGLYTTGNITTCQFPRTEKLFKAKTARLTRLCAEVETYILQNPITPYNEQKTALRAIIQGTGPDDNSDGDKPTLLEAIKQFALTKENNSTQGVYMHTYAKVMAFDEAVGQNEITTEWLRTFEAFLRKDGLSVNGISKHMRNIRAVINYLIDKEEVTQYPFRRFHIKSETQIPFTLNAHQMAQLRDYPCEPWQIIHRDLFMLSFYLCGMNAGDMLLCPKLTNGRMQFRRQKTGKIMDLPVYPEAMEIIQRHKGSKLLLSPMDNNSDYHFFCKRWNKALKTIGTAEVVPDKVGRLRKIIHHPLFPEITTYTARYSFASIAASIGIPHDTIALCLGHSWADVTARYIVYSTKQIDEAVRKVIDAVNNA